MAAVRMGRSVSAMGPAAVDSGSMASGTRRRLMAVITVIPGRMARPAPVLPGPGAMLPGPGVAAPGSGAVAPGSPATVMPPGWTTGPAVTGWTATGPAVTGWTATGPAGRETGVRCGISA